MSRTCIGTLALCAALILLAACDGKKPVERLISEAAELCDAGNFPAAIIKLKTALAQNPKNIPARILSAKVYIDLGKGDAALGTLSRAQQDGATERDLARPRAEADVVARRYDDAIKDTGAPPAGLSNADQASLLASRGAALGALGRETDARSVLAQGLALDPHSVDVRIASARLALGRGDVAAARRDLADATREAPKERRLTQLDGDIAYAARDYPAAEQIYRKILGVEPWNELARGDLAAAQVAENKLTEAIANLDAVLTDPKLMNVPKDPILSYIRAVAAYRQGDFAVGQSYSESVVTRVAGFGPAWLIAGASAYALHEYEQAYYYLAPYVHLTPGDLRGRKLLAETQLQLGRPVDAEKTLWPVRNQATEDPDLLKLIGIAASRGGDTGAADRYLKLAVGREPGDARLRTELGRTQIAAGDPKAGIDNLEQVVKGHPDASEPLLPLFVAFIQTKQYNEALAIAEQVIKNEPKSPTGQLLASTVYLIQGDVNAGRSALLKAREIHKGDVNANTNLAKLALADGKVDDARRYYQDILDANPQSTQTYVALAELDARASRPQEAETVLLKGVRANPANPAVRIALLRFQVLRGEAQQAVDGGEQALKTFPRNPALLDIVGRAELAVGQRDAALSTFHDLVNIAPGAAVAHTDLAEAYLALYTPDNPQWGAVNEAAEAVKLDPKDPVAKLVLGRALAMHGRFEEAAKVMAELMAANPQDVGAIELKALVARGQGQLADAAGAFARAVALNDNAIDRRRLADTEVRLGRTTDAVKTLTTWVDAHPADIATRKMLAEIDVKAGRLAEAHVQYADLVNREPKDPEIQNNLAWVLSRQGRAEEALVHARAAVALAPKAVEFGDTLGAILLQTGNPEEAVTPLDEAWRNGADRPHIGYHLSQALAATGKKDEALALLRQLLAGKRPFAERAQAQALLHNLGG